MHTVSKRTLNQDTAGVLETVTQTGGVVVTERGTPRWYVSPYIAPENPLARLEKEGRYTPPTSQPTPWPKRPGGPRYSESEVTALLDEMRGDH